MVVLDRKVDWSVARVHEYRPRCTGPWRSGIPGLRRHVQNFASEDPLWPHPGSDAVIERYFDDKDTREIAGKTPEGEAATNDLQVLTDLSRSTWSVVDEMRVRD